MAKRLQNSQGQSKKVAPVSLEDLPSGAREIIEALPPDMRGGAISFMIQRVHSGPLPTPEDFLKYEQTLPGAADRILTMAENQSTHRMRMEDRVVKRQQNQSGTGQWLAFVIAIFLISVGGFLVYVDHDTAGASIITVTLVGLVTVFIQGKMFQKRNLENKK